MGLAAGNRLRERIGMVIRKTARENAFAFRRVLRVLVALLLAFGLIPLASFAGSEEAFAAEYTTGKTESDTEYRLYVDKGRGNGDEWNIFKDSILSVSGSDGERPVWCVDITQLYPQGRTASSVNALEVMPQDRLTKLALAYDYAFSNTNGTYNHFGGATWVQRYAMVQAYAWWVMQHAPGTGMANYTIYSIEVLNGEGGWGSQWESAWAEINAYADAEAPTSVGCGTAYVSSGVQTVAALFSVEKLTGAIELQKESANKDLSDANDCYSLEGASYDVYSDAACSKQVARLTTDASGFARVEDVPVGSYWVAEVMAPDGFAFDRTVYPVIVKAGETAQVNGGSVPEAPQYNLIDLLLVKYDSEQGSTVEDERPIGPRSVLSDGDEVADGSAEAVGLADAGAAGGSPNKPEGSSKVVEFPLIEQTASSAGNVAQGAATLAGAEFTVQHFGGFFDDAEQAEAAGSPLRTWVFATDERGFVEFSEKSKVSGADLYLNGEGVPVLPLGTYVIRETKAPSGYVLNEEAVVRWVSGFGDAETVESYWMPQVADDVVRGDLELVKVDEESMARMAGIPFEIVSKTTGERHVIVTDENGYASTASSWAKHSVNTNANDLAASGSYSSQVGVWFGDAEALDDARGALIYDIYTLNELPCKENAAHDLATGIEVTISRDGTCVKLGTIGDAPVRIGTTATDAEDGDHEAWARESVSIVDVVSYSNLTPGAHYRVQGVLMDKETGEPVTANGRTVTAETEFVAERESGTVEVTFSFDASEWKGGDVVVFEELYRALDGESLLVAEHADLESESQTVSLKTPEAPDEEVPLDAGEYGKTGVPLDWVLAGVGVLGIAACTLAVYGIRRGRRA